MRKSEFGNPESNWGRQRKRLSELIGSGSYDAALDELRALSEVRELYPSELVLAGRLLQLCDGDRQTLEEARLAFEKALRLEEDYPQALIELGWFHYAVLDDAKGGLDYFDRALNHLGSLTAEAESGKKDCVREMTE